MSNNEQTINLTMWTETPGEATELDSTPAEFVVAEGYERDGFLTVSPTAQDDSGLPALRLTGDGARRLAHQLLQAADASSSTLKAA
ncbi:Uncharacterised protein [Acidipropionibacterium jensenii]|uniref:Uncharacterized protein n=1 Tax=Acidipropionibacterium jensenii TaxID=1749 RepID=A0A3S4URW5_9ACTN|nr:hypothetical protein [Acidipropionibacterium jensenii]VEI03734.1 Uncharacterised protein [Acidipropionibacterium jensenii]